MWKYVLCSITLMIIGASGDITVTNNAYNGIVIAMRDDLNEANCNTNFEAIKSMISSASELLYNATGNRLSFGEVKVVVPETWTCGGIANSSEGIRLSDAHVMVAPSHPVFLNNPWTQQPRGCGEQGDFIYIPEGYLSSTSEEVYGTTAQAFVQEWAKFRWGVFEETGHSGDAMFPPSYHAMSNDSLTFLPNYCTDQEIVGEQSCTDSTEEKDCIFTPNTDNSNYGITSSLLSVPFLKNVVSFCDSSTHKSDVPTKQNIICDGKSAWDVIKNSLDISENKPSENAPAPIFTLLTATPAFTDKIVIAVEHSHNTAINEDTWEFLRDAVKKFIEVDVKANTAVGLILFSNTIENIYNLTILSSIDERIKLSSLVPKGDSKSTETKNLLEAITKAAALLSNDGAIILMTANLKKLEVEASGLVSAAGGNSVWPILYPHKDGIDTSVYETLAQNTGGHTLTVKSDTHTPLGGFGDFQDVNNYHDMSLKMLQIQSNISNIGTLNEIGVKDCNVQDKDCNVNFEVDDPALYEEEYIIEIYAATSDNPTANFENLEAEIISEHDTYKAYKIKGEM
ncbi:unnamed protein product, partial [Meganyctiphanes norvegica]